MITNRKLTRDAAVKLFTVHVDKSAATDHRTVILDTQRDWVALRVEAICTQTVDTAEFPINVGKVGATTTHVAANVSLTTTAAAGTVVTITDQPIVIAAGTDFGVGHTLASGAGEADIVVHAVPRDTNPSVRVE